MYESHFSVSLVQLIFKPFENGSCLKKLYLKKRKKRSEVQSYVSLGLCLLHYWSYGIPMWDPSCLCECSITQVLFICWKTIPIILLHKLQVLFFSLGCMKFVAHPMVWMNSYFAFFTLFQQYVVYIWLWFVLMGLLGRFRVCLSS